MTEIRRVSDEEHESIAEISLFNGKVRAHHTGDLVRLKFFEGSYAYAPQSNKMTGIKNNGLASGIIVILEPQECLDLITMLQSHYDYVAKNYEFGYGLDE